MSETHPEQFWSFIEHIADGNLEDCGSDLALYGAALSYLKLHGNNQVGLFEYALSLKVVSPRLEASYEYYDVDAGRDIKNWNASLKTCVVYNGIQRTSMDAPGKGSSGKVLPFDHVYQAQCLSYEQPTVVVYSDFQSLALFKELHRSARDAAWQCQIRYVFRLSRPDINMPAPIYLAGYGVEMVLKRTDYIVIDDRNAREKIEADEDAEVVNKAIVPLAPAELEKLGLQAAKHIMSSANPFTTLKTLSQNFLHFMPNLTEVEYSDDFAMPVIRNSRRFPDGDSHMWINGLEIEDPDAFNLLETLQKEHCLMSDLMALGLRSEEALHLLSSNLLKFGSQSSVDIPRFDTREIGEDEQGAVVWLNDLEKDSRYRNWQAEVQHYLRPVYPGQLHSLKRNAYSVIFPLDLAAKEDISLLIEHIANFIQRNLPIRFGIVAISKGDKSRTMASIFYHLVESYGRSAALRYFDLVLQDLQKDKPLSVNKKRFQSVTSTFPLKEGVAMSFDDLQRGGEVLEKCRTWIERLQLNDPAFFVNGRWAARDADWIARMSRLIQIDLSSIQSALEKETLPADVEFELYWLSNAYKRRNQDVFSPSNRYINLARLAIKKKMQNGIRWSEDKSSPNFPCLTTLLVVDIQSDSGKKLLEAAVKFQARYAENIKLGISPSGLANTNPYLHLQNHLAKFEDAVGNFPISDAADVINAVMIATNLELLQMLGLKAGESVIIVNGKVIGPIMGDFDVEDFEMLYEAEMAPATSFQKAISTVSSAGDSFDPITLSAIQSVIQSALKAKQPHERRNIIREDLDTEHISFSKGNTEKASIHITCVIDPVSQLAQKWSSILCSLVDIDDVHVTVILNPVPFMSSLPINRFYQYLSGGKLTFDLSGKMDAPQASFKYITYDDLYTMGVEVPDPWVVMTNESVYDLDNIQLSRIDSVSSVDATYQLKYLLISGHATDVTVRGAPRGVQLQLNDSRSRNDGTIIMANLGYFQLKANPGLWKLEIKNGISSSIFKIDGLEVQGRSQVLDTGGAVELYLTDFRGITGMLKLSRLPGKEREDVLADYSSSHGALRSVKGMLDTVKRKFVHENNSIAPAQSQPAAINIFSVASGHLYERFLCIMITSVLRHTDSPVKFWFIENFLSPSFKVAKLGFYVF